MTDGGVPDADQVRVIGGLEDEHGVTLYRGRETLQLVTGSRARPIKRWRPSAPRGCATDGPPEGYDETRFHVSAPVSAGASVTVHNATDTEATITALDGSFDVVVPGGTLMTFRAPDEPGSYPITSRHSAGFSDVLVVR